MRRFNWAPVDAQSASGRERGHNRRGDGGFTLIELLIVAVIVPLIMGAVAEAIIVSLQNDTSVATRLSSSVNSNLTSGYFVRDVQGASEITTEPQTAASHPLVGNGPFPWQSPEVCASASVLSGGTVPATDTFILGLYRPNTSSTPAMSIGYWLEGSDTSTQVVRYSCQISTASYTTTSSSRVVLADTLASASGPVSANVAISPVSIQTAAVNQWASASPTTFYDRPPSGPANIALPGPVNCAVVPTSCISIRVPSTAGFSAGEIFIETTSRSGPEALTCSGTTASLFTGCSGGSVGDYILPGSGITQGVVSSVQISVTQPPALGQTTSGFHYNVIGDPRAGTSPTGDDVIIPPGGSTLLVLGTGVGGLTSKGVGSSTCPIDGTPKNQLCATGSVTVDAGLSTCNTSDPKANPIDAPGGVSVVSTSGSNCPATGLVQGAPPVSDPIAGTLPNGGCFATSKSLPIVTVLPPGNLKPGIYQTPIKGILEPGVYVLEAGTSGPLSLAPVDAYYEGDANSGVLLYLPPGLNDISCNKEFTYATEKAAPAFSVGGSTRIDLAPLDSRQSEEWFSGSDGASDIWVWQDKDNANPWTFDGTSYISSCLSPPLTSPACGLTYIPDAAATNNSGNPTLITGRMIAGGVQLSGTPSIVLNGS